ncbi:hypothetical protein LL962_13810, partial [Xanthomonas sp. NCPPB 1067]|uniref:hypothetical protein n=1 Tax=Xanthomonas sp. NCPPB 1067 TaxID=487524 RepID=UPI001E4C1B80
TQTTQRVRHVGVTQTKGPPGKPGRFNDDNFGGGQKPSSAVENAVQAIVETLMTTAATVLTRADVEQRLNEAGKSKPDRHRWLKVDAFFAGHPTVEMFKDPARQNLVTYRRKT